MNEATARALTKSYIRYILPSLVGDWNSDRGEVVDYRTLTVCEHAYYAASPYEPLGEDVELAARMYFSPRWLMGACTKDGTQIGSIAISSRATHLVIQEGGMIEGDQSNVFISSGVPTAVRNIPVTPERAVAAVVGAVGKRAAILPELVLQHPLLVEGHGDYVGKAG